MSLSLLYEIIHEKFDVCNEVTPQLISSHEDHSNIMLGS